MHCSSIASKLLFWKAGLYAINQILLFCIWFGVEGVDPIILCFLVTEGPSEKSPATAGDTSISEKPKTKIKN